MLTFTVEGSGSIEDFQETMVNGVLPKEHSGWKPSDWSTVMLGETTALRRHIVPIQPGEHEWRIYIIKSGGLYHAIVLNATSTVMALNGDFYESIVLTFQGIRR